jgi:Txe/YoeB family toxin of toxin-antitoxin system
MYDIQLTKQAEKDALFITRAGLKQKVVALMKIIRSDPFENPPPWEALKGNRKGAYSRRINRQHRLVYEVLPNTENFLSTDGEPYKGIVKIVRMWTHYE